MHRKQVRRRRAVVVVLVVIALALLTFSFRGAAGGGLHSLQQGVLVVLGPIEKGASSALKPARDLVGWFGSTFHAKSQVAELKAENRKLLRQVVGVDAARRQNDQLSRLVHLDQSAALSGFEPVAARVIVRDPTVWYATVQVNQGSDAGIRVNQPVVDGDGLVGTVTNTTASTATVTLITDHTSGVSAKVVETGDPGTVVPSTGDPSDLVLQYLPIHSKVKVGNRVVTAGTRSGRLQSLFPPDLPIGVVTRATPGELSAAQKVHIAPFADLRRLDVVQVLTHGRNGAVAGAPASGRRTDRAQAP